jgi:hypothetical protein
VIRQPGARADERWRQFAQIALDPAGEVLVASDPDRLLGIAHGDPQAGEPLAGKLRRDTDLHDAEDGSPKRAPMTERLEHRSPSATGRVTWYIVSKRHAMKVISWPRIQA